MAMQDTNNNTGSNPDDERNASTGGYSKSPYSAYEPEIEHGLSPVATEKSRNIALLVLVVFGAILFIYYVFFSSEPPKDAAPSKAEQKELASKAVKPESNMAGEPLPAVPSLPAPPALVAPSPPPAPPKEEPKPAPVVAAPPELPKILPSIPTPSAEAKKMTGPSADERRRSSIMVDGGSGGSGGSSKDTSGKDKKEKELTQDEKNQLDNAKPFKLAVTTAKQIRATKIGDMGATIAQGKVIEAVLETAINTDLDGNVRAIVSRDVYAEAGKRVLIPKGSRLIGNYASKVAAGQTRIAMSWVRVIRPDGLDLSMTGLGSAIDNLGRAGVEGLVDNHYFEVLYNAALLSTAQVAWASAADKMTNSGASTTTTTTQPTGQITSSSSNTATQQAIQTASNSMGQAVQSIAQTGLKTTPTITIDQGTTIKIYVNQDLVFPPQGSHSNAIKVGG